MTKRHHLGIVVLTISILCLVIGCVPESTITSYTIDAEEEPITTDRLLPIFQARVPPPIERPDFDRPKSWRKAANDEFSLAAFAAGPNDRPVRITVTRTPAAMGVDVQLNRWRSQLELDPLPSDDVIQAGEEIQVMGQPARLVTFDGEQESIVGTIAVRSGQMWFYKMRGPKKSVAEQFDTMKAFCQQAKLNDN